MGLIIRNIGKVSEAEIELSGITIVAGNNASGKSTISKSLYTILDIFHGWRNKAVIQRNRSRNKIILDWSITVDGFQALNPLLEVQTRQEIRRLFVQKKVDEAKFTEKLKKILEDAGIEEYTQDNLDELHIKYDEYKATSLDYYSVFFAKTVLEGVFFGQVNTINQKNTGRIEYLTDKTEYFLEIEDNRIKKLAKDNRFAPEIIKPIYITTSDLMDSVGSERKLYHAQKMGGISYANSQLANLLMNEISIGELTAEEYDKIEEQMHKFDFILDTVVDGEMRMENNQLVYYDDAFHAKLEFANIASGMRIFLILKRLIRNGILLERSCLIIDEPETNLHPEWQLKLAELLVLLQKEMNIKIYANSHSPYFVRAIEYFADQYQALEDSRFYFMEQDKISGMFRSRDVTEELGIIYDKMAEPFNQIM